MSVRFMNIRHLLMVDIVRQYRELVHVHLSRILHSELSMVSYSSLPVDVYRREKYKILFSTCSAKSINSVGNYKNQLQTASAQEYLHNYQHPFLKFACSARRRNGSKNIFNHQNLKVKLKFSKEQKIQSSNSLPNSNNKVAAVNETTFY